MKNSGASIKITFRRCGKFHGPDYWTFKHGPLKITRSYNTFGDYYEARIELDDVELKWLCDKKKSQIAVKCREYLNGLFNCWRVEFT